MTILAFISRIVMIRELHALALDKCPKSTESTLTFKYRRSKNSYEKDKWRNVTAMTGISEKEINSVLFDSLNI